MVMDKGGQWIKYRPIENQIAEEPVDPYLFFRLLDPGYESWKKISIKQRCVKNFKESSLIENTIADDNCVNCHTFSGGSNRQFLFHMRGIYVAWLR